MRRRTLAGVCALLFSATVLLGGALKVEWADCHMWADCCGSGNDVSDYYYCEGTCVQEPCEWVLDVGNTTFIAFCECRTGFEDGCWFSVQGPGDGTTSEPYTWSETCTNASCKSACKTGDGELDPFCWCE